MKFARKCSVTGKGINEGYIIDGEWFATQREADIYAREIGYEDYAELCLFYNFDEYGEELENNENECFWTSFEDVDGEIEAQGEYYTAEGKLITINS